MNKHKKGQFFIIPLEVYPFDILVSIDENDSTLVKRLIKHGITKDDFEHILDSPLQILGRCILFESNQLLIRLNTQKNKIDFISTVVHESFHAATFMLSRAGVKFQITVSDEAYAYLLDYIVKEILKRILHCVR